MNIKILYTQLFSDLKLYSVTIRQTLHYLTNVWTKLDGKQAHTNYYTLFIKPSILVFAPSKRTQLEMVVIKYCNV